MATPWRRLRGGLLVGAVLGTCVLPVTAEAHNPTYQGTVQYGHGGTSGGAYGNTSLTLHALMQSGCTSTKFQGQEMNGFDAAVIPAHDLANHTVKLTWKANGNTGNMGSAAVWAYFLDSTCTKKPIPKAPINAQYLTDRTFVAPGGMKWLLLQPESGVTGAEWKVIAKDPPKPKPKPRRR